jgi:hypothetical protein
MDRDQPNDDENIETSVERQHRLELEARLIAEARASAAAGLTISLEAIKALGGQLGHRKRTSSA